ncbi:MAG: phycobilisome protein [Cyanobacteria bacterium J06632_3]
MLSQLNTLAQEADGRFATDAELMFLQNYLRTARLRFSAYQKIQAAESKIIQQVQEKLEAMDPSMVLKMPKADMSHKWRRDSSWALRYSAQALLIDDQDSLQERLLYWFQTMMRAFKVERSYNATYIVMQDIVKQYLSAEETELFIPILELVRSTLCG